ncbi:uncharacterized protein LOC112194247 [Rosa chinensis]|uniref:uncharacterized protein LOC112194247 n=1 Tax=Rosa chinensis TaxID=74649 RepID=UPI000D08793D|nr:uncharacterized protein LOC112194247 [Rosa chinensis]
MSKAIFWNARGAGSDKFRSDVSDLIQIHKVDIIAICEPRVQFSKAEKCFEKLGFSDHKIMEATGFSGGIWLLWDKSKLSVDVIDVHFQAITAKINLPGASTWILSIIYASPTYSMRASLWGYLENLFAATGLPYALIGDFNELLDSFAKNMGSLVGRFGGLRDWVNRNGIIDIGFQVSTYTWTNGRIKERLDRGLCSSDWRIAFPEAFIKHLAKMKSDHCPIATSLK